MISKRVRRLSGQGWSGFGQGGDAANLLKDNGWSGWSGRSGWNRANRYTREQHAGDAPSHTHGHQIHPDHPDHPDHVNEIRGLDRSGCLPPPSTTLTNPWPAHLLGDPAEVILRGELDAIEQEFSR